MFQGCFLWDRTSRVCLQLKLTQSAMFSLVQKWCKNRGTKCIIFYEYAMQGFGSVFLHALQPLSSILALCSQVSPWLHLCRMQDEEQTVKSPNNLTPKSSKNCFLSQVTVFFDFCSPSNSFRTWKSDLITSFFSYRNSNLQDYTHNIAFTYIFNSSCFNFLALSRFLADFSIPFVSSLDLSFKCFIKTPMKLKQISTSYPPNTLFKLDFLKSSMKYEPSLAL